MGFGTRRCCNSTANDAISRVHLHGRKLQDAPQSVSPKRDAGRQFLVLGRYSGTDGRQVDHSGEITVQRQPGVHQPFLPLYYFHYQQHLLSQDGGTVVPAPRWAPPRERQEGVSTQACREANPAVGLQCLPNFTREHIWIRVLQVHLSSTSFFQSFVVIPPRIQTIWRVCRHKRAEAQSRHPEEHPQVGEDCTVGEDVVLAAALGLIAHQPWHQDHGTKVVEHGLW